MSRFVLAQISRLKGFAKKILPQRLSQNHYRVFFVFLIVLFFVFFTQFVHAAGGGVAEWFVQAVASILLTIAQVAIALTIFFLRYFITLASYNDYINVNVVKLGWVMVRDVANMFFVVSLLVIAFATILGIEKFEWKKSLVKLVIMAILINFSNLIAQLIIDVAHVFTITFLNAVSASAGGNLINMFSMDQISKTIASGQPSENVQGFTLSILAASVLSLIFALGTAFTIGSYAIIMALRVVVLWALIILSPLAYLFSALPKGEKYASKWWSEFTSHVIVAPVMVFFMWLSFATLGTGQIMSEIQQGSTISLEQSQGSDALSASLASISTWQNMANYILAMIFLLIGLKITKETGASGAGLAGAAENFIKKTATVASGYATARMLLSKGTDQSKSLVGKAGKGVSNYLYKKTGLKKLKNRINAGWQNRRTNRIEAASQKAKKREEEIEKTTNPFKKAGLMFKAMLLQPVERADKQAEYYEREAKHHKDRAEESVSASDTPAGKSEQRAYQKLQVVLKTKEGKKLLKENQYEAQINAVNEIVDIKVDEKLAEKHPERAQGIAQANGDYAKEVKEINGYTRYSKDLKKQAGQNGADLDKLNGDELAKAIEKAKSDLLTKALDKHDVAVSNIDVLHPIEANEREEAKAEVLQTKNNEILDYVAEKMSAGDKVEKDKQRRILGREHTASSLYAEAGVLSKGKGKAAEASSKAEEIGVDNTRAREIKIAEARDQVRMDKGGTAVHYQQTLDKHTKARDEEYNGLNYREITKQAQNLAKKINESLNDGKTVSPESYMQLSSILSAAHKQSAEAGDAALNGILKSVGFKQEEIDGVGTDDLLGKQRLLFSALSGKKIEPGNQEDVLNAFEGMKEKFGGEDKFQAMLKNLDTAIKAAGSDGLLHQVGLLNDRQLDGNGRVKIRLETDKKEFREKRDYVATRQNLTKLTSVGGFVSKKDGKFSLDGRSMTQMIGVLKSAKSNTHFTSAFLDEMEKLRRDDKEGFENLLKALPEDARNGIGKQLSPSSSSPTAPPQVARPAPSGKPVPPKGSGPKRSMEDAFKDKK
ncbi:MAG: hypothetical protein AUJ23_01670 [Candidatus Magasanikbacteria bacterium CG1_02_32_51]|uniref:Uncharacterized protein n=1 Tax=Candidatus Magasanikbacteria bacterium CG1_02_32_51 TaxID=1805238 RepID=A0A1J4UAV4_9BACT|nr:MAG: hypothetical protein AUJ23_01670 [Candidatus Magasanikbacteria bacterium CG1_02_32_51]